MASLIVIDSTKLKISKNAIKGEKICYRKPYGLFFDFRKNKKLVGFIKCFLLYWQLLCIVSFLHGRDPPFPPPPLPIKSDRELKIQGSKAVDGGIKILSSHDICCTNLFTFFFVYMKAGCFLSRFVIACMAGSQKEAGERTFLNHLLRRPVSSRCIQQPELSATRMPPRALHPPR